MSECPTCGHHVNAHHSECAERPKAPAMQGDEIEAKKKDCGCCYTLTIKEIVAIATATEARGYERGKKEWHDGVAVGEKLGFERCREEAAKVALRHEAATFAGDLTGMRIAEEIRKLKP